MKPVNLLLAILILAVTAQADESLPLRPDGSLQAWLTNGPFEIRTVGFGDLSDDAPLDEERAAPRSREEERNPGLAEEKSPWLYLSARDDGFTDLNAWYGWKTLITPEKVWYAKIVYACAELVADRNREAILSFGGNTITRIVLNGETVYHSLRECNAVRDNFSVPVTLKKGNNRLLIRTANSHRNHAVDFIDPLRFEWGFYCRLLDSRGKSPLAGVSQLVWTGKPVTNFALTPTFFYKKKRGGLVQKYLLEIHSGRLAKTRAVISIPYAQARFTLNDIAFGANQRELYLPAVEAPVKVPAALEMAGESLNQRVELKSLPRYELYFMPLTHMDIGYTNPQPVVIERQLQTLDQAVEKCAADSSFRWTIETMWLLENYRRARSEAAFARLIALIRAGRIAVSPIYSNPYTGWVSEAEMAASFRIAGEYKRCYGLDYFAAVYNDVPGQSWALPQYLRKAGVRFLADGINELFADYKFQKSLPKVFHWAGSSSDTLLLYLTEAYIEGARYGLEREPEATACRIWHRVHNLLRRDYPFTKILISGAYSDNSGIALTQYENALRWNNLYAWPRFVIATLDDFGRALCAENPALLETRRGDWTSDWDILYQGETRRMTGYRAVQNQLPGVELLAALSAAMHPETRTGAGEIDAVYEDLLGFSGHGSGLEYGFGSREENLYTDAVRDDHVRNAAQRARALRERLLYRLTAPKESFDSHGIMVYNTLSWERSAPVEIDFPATDTNDYAVIDLASGAEIPGHRSGERLSFVARELPGIGSRQFELVTRPAPAAPAAGPLTEKNRAAAGKERAHSQPEKGRSAPVQARGHAALPAASGPAIENEYYRISSTGKGIEILDAATGRPLMDPAAALPSFLPLRKRFQLNESFAPVAGWAGEPGIARNPVYEELSRGYTGALYRTITFRLWRGLNRIDIAVEIDLEALQKSEHTEEYGLAFAFNARGGEIRCETLGGLTTLEERFSGVGHTFFSIRRALGAETAEGTLLLASPDCRVFALDTLNNAGTVIANLVNNFPESWNRNEVNSGRLTFRFHLAAADAQQADIAAFGWEAAAEPLARRSWYTRAEPVQQYLTSSNPRVKILSLRPAGEENGRYELLLQNSDPEAGQVVTLQSALWLAGAAVTELDLLGCALGTVPVQTNAITLTLPAKGLMRIGIEKKP